ncbi:MAG: hypothetical protein ACN4GR_04030 [Arenicellales bacterium]
MTSVRSMTCMVADIVGSSLIMQEDQRKGIDLYETFQSILVPLIEKKDGFAIEFTGDAVSACFSNFMSAIATGFAIQNALEARNLPAAGPGLNARIGIYSSQYGNNEYQQQLSLAAATCLQSLGRADALCVSACMINEINMGFPVFSYSRGKYDLGFLSEPAAVFYLYQERPGFLSRQKLRLGHLNAACCSQIKKVITSPAMAVPSLLVLAVLLFYSMKEDPYTVVRDIEISETRDFTEGKFDREISKLNRVLKEEISSLAGISVLRPGQGSMLETRLQAHPAIRLVSSFQHNSDRVRLTWAVLQQDGSVQSSGGVVTGRLENLLVIESQFIQNILSELDSKN